MKNNTKLYTFKQFLRFIIVGATGTAGHFSTLILMVELGGVNPVLSSAAGFIVGAIINYFLNYYFTFRSEKKHLTTMTKFFFVAIITGGVNVVMMDSAIYHFQLNYLIAQVIATVTVLLLNFLINFCWTFKKTDKDTSLMGENLIIVKGTHSIKINVNSMILSIIVPAYNEESVLPEFHKRLMSVLDEYNINAEIIYVNDGSTDETVSVILGFRKNDARVSLIDLSRNFGKEIAMTAGFNHSKGDAVVVIDSDLQDPPELIPELIQRWQEGYDVVYAKRTSREGETFLKKATAHLFYRVIRKLNDVDIPTNTGDFRLLSRRAVEALNELPEHHRFMKGLFAWIGFPQIAVYYKRDPRFSGDTKWNYWKLWNFALEGITSFTIVPLKMASYTGLIVAFGAFIYALWIIYKTITLGDPVAGYPTIITVILFLGGLQLMTLGVIGEYLGRMFNETKRRPLYFIQNHYESNVQDIKKHQ